VKETLFSQTAIYENLSNPTAAFQMFTGQDTLQSTSLLEEAPSLDLII
jgi:hypothetical protein